MFGDVMQSGLLAEELTRMADEARAARERLRELARQAAELRARLEPVASQTSGSAPDEKRPLHSVQ
jgi:hypothetical protein